MSEAIVITGAKRTAIGAFKGGYRQTPAVDLGAAAISGAIAQSQLEPTAVDELILGQILTAGAGQNPARQAATKAGIPNETTSFQVNQLCGSGLRAVALGCQAIALGEAEVVVAGGQENMTRAPHSVWLRQERGLGDYQLRDTMQQDGLHCALCDLPMGVTAENVAEQWQISRAQQDQFAVDSQNKAERSINQAIFAEEITPVANLTVTVDEPPRFATTTAGLAKLKPAFIPEGSVTAGNACAISDGAAAVVLMPAKQANQRGLTPLARVVSWSTAGVEPALMGTGPIPASQQALAKAGWRIDEVDLIEINEAFAAQVLAVIQTLGCDQTRVNVHGGAIALGHPIGASGARILTTLIYALKRHRCRRGLATLCIGGGMGIAMCIESLAS